MVAVNMNGALKEPTSLNALEILEIIAKSQDLDDIFTEVIGKKEQKLVDNSPAHPAISDLWSVTLVFLPTNTT